MMNKSTKPILLVLAIIFAGLLAVSIFGIYEIRTKNTEISILVNDADQAAEMGDLIQTIKELQENASGDLQIFDEAVFMDEKLVPLIESIEGIGRNFGLETRIVSVSEIEDKKSEEPKIIKLVIETTGGSWGSTFAFLRAMENLPHRIMVEEGSLSRETESWRLRLGISIHSFN